jgi:hypothetical protein
MSRPSDYTDEQILEIIHASGYKRLSGVHKNGASVHVLKHSCGMINEKNSKTLLSKKRGCRFIPCHARGALSLQHIKSIAAEYGIDQVTPIMEPTVPLDRLEISADDKLCWHRDGLVMTQSWNEVRKRALSTKKGAFFQADGTRRKLRSPVLTQIFLEQLCNSKHLLRPTPIPTRRSDKVLYTHIPCANPVSLRFSELENWNEAKCMTCHSPEQTALAAFLSFLVDAEMDYSGTLRMLPDRKQVDRSQVITIECRACKLTNKAKRYDLIRYRGFIYCDNPFCRNTYLTEDKTGESDQYYIDLLRKYKVTSFAEAKQLFPRAMQYLKTESNEINQVGPNKVFKYEVVRKALGFETNTLTRNFSDAELQHAFQAAINAGATNLGQLRSMLPNDINNYITRQKAKGDMIHHRLLKEMRFRFKQSYEINSLEDAKACVRDTQCLSWSAFINRYPGPMARIMSLGYKEDIFAEFGWSPLVNYSRLTNDELLARASTLCHDEKLKSLNQLERAYGSLVRNIRERNLLDDLCTSLGFEQPSTWQGMRFDDLVAHVRKREFASSSDWHAECSGSYKYASSQNWVRNVSAIFGWGQYKGLNGFRYDSLPETIVANLLYLSEYEFEDHPAIEQFPGYGGGQPFADFRLDATLWVEIWAYCIDDTPPAGKFEKYPQIREHKEKNYSDQCMPLCSIEGGLFYRKQTINGIMYRRGLSSFVRHACDQLSKHGYPISYNPELLNEIRKSVLTQSESSMINL